MKMSVFITAFALSAVMAVPVLAQEPPPYGPMPSPNPQMRQEFEAAHKQMQQIHAQERSQVLGALTPAHLKLLGTVAAELATSTTPDYRGAAQRLDAALSSSEKQTIVSAAQNARQQMRAQMQTMRQQMSQMSGRPNPGGPMIPAGPGGEPQRERRTPSAGEILLRVAMGGGGMEMGMHESIRP
jgi:hypothetical protein